MWQARGTDSSSFWLDHSVQVNNGIGALPGAVLRGTENGPAFDITIVGCPIVPPLTKPGCPKSLVIELFILRRLGKQQNLHVEYARANFEEFAVT